MKTFMKNLVYTLIAICFIVASCSDDENKLTWTSDSVKTMEALNITSTNAELNGYINFFGEMNDFLDGLEYSDFEEEDTLSTEDLILILNLSGIESIDIPENCPDSVVIKSNLCDFEFIEAGMCYDINHDFRDVIYVPSTNVKVKHISTSLSNLQPNTTYFYKTYLKFKMIYELTCDQIPALNSGVMVDDGDNFYAYYVYGDTKSFTTLK